MKLKIRDSGEEVCEVWLEQQENGIDLVWKDELDNKLYIARLHPNKTITIYSSSGFTQKK